MVKCNSSGEPGGIAQLGERLLDKQEVTGSKPVVPTTRFIPNPTSRPFLRRAFCIAKKTQKCWRKSIVFSVKLEYFSSRICYIFHKSHYRIRLLDIA